MVLVVFQVRPMLPPPDALAPTLRNIFAGEQAYTERIRGASIYPAVQNIILACRALGLGTTITTNHIRCEDELRALLGLPEDVDTFAMMPIGWLLEGFGPVLRQLLAEITYGHT